MAPAKKTWRLLMLLMLQRSGSGHVRSKFVKLNADSCRLQPPQESDHVYHAFWTLNILNYQDLQVLLNSVQFPYSLSDSSIHTNHPEPSRTYSSLLSLQPPGPCLEAPTSAGACQCRWWIRYPPFDCEAWVCSRSGCHPSKWSLCSAGLDDMVGASASFANGQSSVILKT